MSRLSRTVAVWFLLGFAIVFVAQSLPSNPSLTAAFDGGLPSWTLFGGGLVFVGMLLTVAARVSSVASDSDDHSSD